MGARRQRRLPVGGGYHSVIGGTAFFVGAACPSRSRFSTVVVQFCRDRALGVARAVAFPPTGCQASVHPHYCLLGFSHQNSPTVCAWLVRHGRRACGAWQAPSAINSTICYILFQHNEKYKELIHLAAQARAPARPQEPASRGAYHSGWLVRRGRRARGVRQAPNAINLTIWRHFVSK